MRITFAKFLNGEIGVTTEAISVVHTGEQPIATKIVDMSNNQSEEYFRSPDEYVVDFENGTLIKK